MAARVGDDEHRGSVAAGDGRPPSAPPDVDIAVGEGPMRRELLRQIEQLERSNTRFVHDNCPWEPIPASPLRGPAVLSNAQLEAVRDELIEARAALHDRTVRRAAEEVRVRPSLWSRLRSLLARGSD